MSDLLDTNIFPIIGVDGFTRLVAAFYRRVAGDDILRPMYPGSDLTGAEQRLREFLIQRFGGPMDYSARRGHPRLRMRHALFPIDQRGRDRWVMLMEASLAEVQLPEPAIGPLRKFFHEAATFMINRDEGLTSDLIRPFQQTDLAGVLGVLAGAMPADPISKSRFTRQVLLDPNFRAEGMPVAIRNGEATGFCLALARQTPLENAPPDADRGYITLIAVAPSAQRQGVGAKLLEHAEDFLRSQGRSVVMVSSYAPGYFLPGVDVNAYAGALSFFAAHGYAEVYRPIAMQTSLWDFSTPTWVKDRHEKLAGEGVQIVAYTPAITLPLLDFAKQEFPGDWVRVVRETAGRILTGESPARLLVALDSGAVVGFSHYENERFGPIGVAASQRGRGVGQVLMYATLQAQREAGFRTAWFLWSDDKTAARLYTGAGFKETRRFAILKKSI
jgi:mycothiol synthase